MCFFVNGTLSTNHRRKVEWKDTTKRNKVKATLKDNKGEKEAEEEKVDEGKKWKQPQRSKSGRKKVFRKERGQKILSGAISHKICCSCFFFFLPPTEAENSALRCFWPNLWTDSKWPISFFRRNRLLSIGNVVRELISVRSARNNPKWSHQRPWLCRYRVSEGTACCKSYNWHHLFKFYQAVKETLDGVLICLLSL